MTIEQLFEMSLEELRALDHDAILREFGHLLPAIREPIADMQDSTGKTAAEKRRHVATQHEMKDMLASLQSLKSSLPKNPLQ